MSSTPSVTTRTPDPRPQPLDPKALWAATLDAVGRSNASAWMSHFRLARFDTAGPTPVAYLAPAPGASHARNFATGPRLARVAETLTALTNAPVRVELEAPATPGSTVAGAVADDPDALDTPRPAAAHSAQADPARHPADAHTPDPAAPESATPSPPPPASPPPPPTPQRLDRRTALNLPLVRDAFDVFPDATLIDARREPNA